ncbi:MAG: YCF48-related protein [Ignavibacteriaceae bacterium]|nr:YCF48-related protein [Ignavibacteriaceae bacterium]
MLKIYYLILVSLFFNENTLGQNFWTRIQSPTDQYLRTLCFLDSLKGWVAGDSGMIFYTDDGGKNWQQQQIGSNYTIMDLFFLNDSVGWGVAWEEVFSGRAYGTYILKTSDAGQTWFADRYSEDAVFLKSIYFLDTLNGFMGGYPGNFLRTTDGGINWEYAIIDSGFFSYFPPIHFIFLNEFYGFACGGIIDIQGVVWRTTNGGESWESQAVGPEPIHSIHFFDSLNVIGVGGDYEYGASMIQSTNAGETWNYQELGIFGAATALSFRTRTEAWAPLSFAATIMATFNAGLSWTDTATVDTSRIYDLVFTDSLTGYAVGEAGVILKYKFQNPVSVTQSSLNSPEDFILYQNYPNPFNPTTNIKYSIPAAGIVTLKVYDLLGMEVSTLVNDYQQAGTFDVVFDGSNLASGVYYYQLITGELSATRKLMLTK